MAGLSLSEGVIALDMDKMMNWRVRDALEKIIALVTAIPGIRVRLMNWNATFKGVDDFYQARNYAASKGVNILDISSMIYRKASVRIIPTDAFLYSVLNF